MHSQENNEMQEEADIGSETGMEYLDEAIAMLDEYIENPKLVTEETLTDLRDKLLEMKESMEGETKSKEDNSDHVKMKGEKPLSAIIVNMRRMK